MGFASSDVETDGVSSFGYHSEYGANSLAFLLERAWVIKDLIIRYDYTGSISFVVKILS